MRELVSPFKTSSWALNLLEPWAFSSSRRRHSITAPTVDNRGLSSQTTAHLVRFPKMCTLARQCVQTSECHRWISLVCSPIKTRRQPVMGAVHRALLTADSRSIRSDPRSRTGSGSRRTSRPAYTALECSFCRGPPAKRRCIGLQDEPVGWFSGYGITEMRQRTRRPAERESLTARRRVESVSDPRGLVTSRSRTELTARRAVWLIRPSAPQSDLTVQLRSKHLAGTSLMRERESRDQLLDRKRRRMC